MSLSLRMPARGALLLSLAFLCACPSAKTVRKPVPGAGEAAGSARSEGDEAVRLPSAADILEAQIRGKEFVQTPDLQTVRFDYDATSLGDEGRAALRANAEYLRQHPDLEVLVEGHCDERGTTEYNLSLGQRRAKTVRDYYMRVGVPGSKVATISFGEERPACPASTEECWGRNRRAETKVRAQVSSAAPAPTGGQVR